MGFYELRSLEIPSVSWNEFTHDTQLDSRILWTIRVAVENSFDISLPRAVGVASDKASARGLELLEKYGQGGMVVYYPYFIAEKSGVLEVSQNRTVIEAVKGDLWNMATYGCRKDVTIICTDIGVEYSGNKSFLSDDSLNELTNCAARLKKHFRDELAEGLSILAEWSFAYNTDTTRKPIGDVYLVFYELRSV